MDTNKKLTFVGIDGCKSGWFYIGRYKNGKETFGILSTIDELPRIADETTVIFIDIPIGLRYDDKNERSCDLEARKLLKKRASSIFPTPCRPALYGKSYEESCRINFEHTGKKLSVQTYNILPKIREVDAFVLSTGEQFHLREFHPELGFLALNRFIPLEHSKKTEDGRMERINILKKYIENIPDIIDRASKTFLRKQAAPDDIIDAAAGLVSARLKRGIVSLPEIPETDENGIRMEIVYTKVGS